MSPIQFNADAIPAELRDPPNWVVWKSEPQKGRQTKVPYNARTGARASSTDPRSWTTFQEALTRYQRSDGRYDGIGFVFSEHDDFFGVDLDACRDPQSGALTEWAAEIVEAFETYSEVSPSGTGVKLVARGKLPGGKGRAKKLEGVPTFGDKQPEIAVYDRGRFWCMTGQRLTSAPKTCEARQEQLDGLLCRMFPPKGTSKRLEQNGNVKLDGTLFDRLLADCACADVGQRSERDFALCAAALRHGWPRQEVWHRVRSIGKFLEGGERYLDLTWERAQEAAAGDRKPRSSRKAVPTLVGQQETPDLRTESGRTDAANARRLAQLYGADLHWIEPWRKWLAWDGRRWTIDAEKRVDAMAMKVSDEVWRRTAELLPIVDRGTVYELIQFARRSASAHGISAMLSLAKSEPGIPILPDKLDTDPWALNVQNGTLDLRTGELRPHDRADLITKLCSIEHDPAAKCPNFESMLATIMAEHDGLITFLQRAVGYSLTGIVTEQVLFLLWGKGANGKSTFLNAILDTLGGDFGMQAPDSLLMVKHGESHPTERADLFGKRFVSSVEVEEGRRLAESLVKQLTGGDAIRARKMREDFWEFLPTHKLWMAANHKPQIRGTDHGIWRRVKLIPFDVTIAVADQDKKLPDKLKAERPGILAWAVRGCIDWQQHGLGEPDEVKAATAAYRAEMDVLGMFMAECCIEGQGRKVKASRLYATYDWWCKANGEYAVNQRRFGMAIAERPGIKRYANNGSWYRGVGLVTEATEVPM